LPLVKVVKLRRIWFAGHTGQMQKRSCGGFSWGKFLKSGQWGGSASIKSLTEADYGGYELY